MPTTKVSGLGDNFYLGGYDLSGDLASVDTISGARDVNDVTAINQLANQRLYGLKGGSWSFTTFFDVVGTTNAPGVPGSGTPLVSTFNWNVFVTVIGGTVSNVVINGVSVGTGDGTYILPALGTITLTYSAAPTWTWTAVGAEHSALSAFPNTDTQCLYFRAQAQGNVCAAMNSKQTDYDFTRDTTGNLTAKVDMVPNGFGMEWGWQLTAGIRVDTAASAPVGFQDPYNSAATAFGGQAYLQLFAFVGTSVDIAVQSSATLGGTYTTVTGLDFGSQSSAPYQARLQTANNVTIQPFLKVTTTGTFSYARFAVMIVRNAVLTAF